MTPRFLIYSLLEQKINESVKEIETILQIIDKNTSPIILKSVFSYGVSHFENIFTIIIKDICTGFPDRITSKDFKLSKKQIIDDDDVLELFLDNAINNITYKDLPHFIEKYHQIIQTPKIEDDKIDHLIEIKETRNLIIHNNLKINKIYLEKCEKNSFCRASVEDMGKTLNLDYQYVRDSITFIRNFILKDIIPDLTKKYGNLTQKEAMKKVWNHLFSSSILQFDDFWDFDDKGNLKSCLKPYVKRTFSKTEELLFAKILIHYSGDARYDDHETIFPAYKFNTNEMFGDRYDAYLYLEKVLNANPKLFNKDL